jgi:hypothetical protein
MSIFISREEGRRLFTIYSRACDPLGLMGLGVLYLVSVILGSAIMATWFLYACFLGFTIMSRNALPGLLDFRVMRFSVISLGRSIQGGLSSLMQPPKAIAGRWTILYMSLLDLFLMR